MASQNHFKQLLRRAAHSADVVVPVVSLPTIQETIQGCVSATESVFRQEWANRITAVVVTKIQQAEVDVAQKEEASLAMWKTTSRSKDVYCCDSLLGLGGLWLRDYISEDKDVPEIYRDKEKRDPICEV